MKGSLQLACDNQVSATRHWGAGFEESNLVLPWKHGRKSLGGERRSLFLGNKIVRKLVESVYSYDIPSQHLTSFNGILRLPPSVDFWLHRQRPGMHEEQWQVVFAAKSLIKHLHDSQIIISLSLCCSEDVMFHCILDIAIFQFGSKLWWRCHHQALQSVSLARSRVREESNDKRCLLTYSYSR